MYYHCWAQFTKNTCVLFLDCLLVFQKLLVSSLKSPDFALTRQVRQQAPRLATNARMRTKSSPISSPESSLWSRFCTNPISIHIMFCRSVCVCVTEVECSWGGTRLFTEPRTPRRMFGLESGWGCKRNRGAAAEADAIGEQQPKRTRSGAAAEVGRKRGACSSS